MRHTQPAVQKLNDLLRTELGTSASGEPLYQWRYTGDLVDCFAVHHKDGTPAKEVYTTPAGIIAVRVRTVRRLQRPDRPNHWAICYWEAPVPPDEWARIYGTLEDYPTHGTYMIPSDDKILREGEEPFLQITQDFIKGVRKVRQKTVAQRVADSLEAEQKAEKADDALIEDWAADKFAAFMNPTPGKRGGHVSFGGIDVKERPHVQTVPAA